MPAPIASSDAFTAIAEPRRRDILVALGGGELPVGAIVEELGLDQPTVSKHLRVLREAGLVRVRREGRKRMYRVNGVAIRPVHEFASTFERFWTHQLEGIKQLAETRARAASSTHTPTRKGELP